MRATCLVIASGMLASCAPPPSSASELAANQRQLAQLIGGKVARPPVSCLPTYRAGDMTVIDESTIAFRRTSSEVYLAHMRAPCANVGRAGYALLTREVGSTELCSGDIAQVIDTATRMPAGSCVFGEFTPYVRP